MNFKELDEVISVGTVLTEPVFNTLIEFSNYNSNGMRVTVTKALTTLKERIDRGDKITFYKTGQVFDVYSFRNMVYNTFGEQMFESVTGIEMN